MELYLQHHGILGQKWGVRRYQNTDGTLTSEGKARLSSKIKQTVNSDAFKEGKDGKASPAEKATRSAQDAVNSTSKIVNKVIDRAEAKKNAAKRAAEEDRIKNMSDEELRRAVQRLQLEKQLKDLSPKTISHGKEFTREFFEIATSVAGLGVSIATIATVFNKIK